MKGVLVDISIPFDPDAPWGANDLLIILTIVVISIAPIIWAMARAETARKKEHRDDRDKLIDQIQQERDAAARQAEKDREMYQAQMDKFWADKRLSRQHVASLEDHIWKHRDPPPPPPPAGYIP